MIVRPFQVSDLEHYRDRAVEIGARDWLSAPDLSHLENGYGFTAIEGETLLASGGLIDVGRGIAIAWAVMTQVPRALLIPVQRECFNVLRQGSFRRVEAHVDPFLHVSHRWLRFLGFRMDAEHPTQFVNGVLLVRYVMV